MLSNLLWSRVTAPFACHAISSRGRLFSEPACPVRSPFQRDRDRIIHSSAFRRLTYKTQVFIYHEGDHYRTRLTHSLEVAQIARTLARTLGLDEDLAEAIALAHDLGHTPFGHAGEEALDAAMAHSNGFDHNAQSLRIVTNLERRYAGFDGLNLSWETLEGLVKHNGPLLPQQRPDEERETGVGNGKARHGKMQALPHAIAVYAAKHDLELYSHASAEAQLAALADDIAYNNHDIDDGLRSGLISLEQVRTVPLVRQLLDEVKGEHGALPQDRLIFEVNRRLISAMVLDVIGETRRRLAILNPDCADAIRQADAPVVAFSRQMGGELDVLRGLLRNELYHHQRITEMMASAKQIVRDLFDYFRADPGALPEEWRVGLNGAQDSAVPRRVCDFVAGMTDRFALDLHRRLFDDTPKLR